MLELYHFSLSVCAHKVRMTLGEKQLPWTSRIVDLHAGAQFAPEYLRLNPNAVVPTLVHDGAVITESTIICEYLDDAFPATPLRPGDPCGRAQLRHWTKLVDEGLHAACGTLTIAAAAGMRAERIRAAGQTIEAYVAQIPDAARRDRQHQVLRLGLQAPGVAPAWQLFLRTLHRMDDTLGTAPYLAGTTISLADTALAPYVLRLDMMQLLDTIPTIPRVLEWYQRMRQHRGFGEILHYISVPEAETMRSYGLAARAALPAAAA